MFRKLIQRWKQRAWDRRQLDRLIAEIDTLSQNDLNELGAFKVDLYEAAHRQVYG